MPSTKRDPIRPHHEKDRYMDEMYASWVVRDVVRTLFPAMPHLWMRTSVRGWYMADRINGHTRAQARAKAAQSILVYSAPKVSPKVDA